MSFALRVLAGWAPLLLAILGSLPGAPAAGEEPLPNVVTDGPVIPVTRFVVEYQKPHPDQPDLGRFLPLDVNLGRLPSGFVEPRPGVPIEQVRIGFPSPGPPRPFHTSAIGAVSRAILVRLREEGLLGVFVAPDPQAIAADGEEDRRGPGEQELRLIVSTARVRTLRSVASGGRIHDEWRIDNEAHRRILELSPIRPGGAPGTTDLLREDWLDDYLFRLNRHPGRRVDAALSPAPGGDGVALDYLVREAKPWYAYAQVSNTGTDRTYKWQQRYGYVNNQTTDNDDIFSFEFLDAGIGDLNAVSGSYEAPWFSSKRPWWMGEEAPSWLSWANLPAWPWWGSDRVRWRAFGSYTDYSASQVDGTDDVDGEEWDVGLRLIHQTFQHRNFFVDLFGGVAARGVKVENKASACDAEHFLLLPQGGFQSERVNEYSTFFTNVTFEGNVTGSSTSRNAGQSACNGFDALGRANVDDEWVVVTWDGGLTYFMEPLVNLAAWEDPSTALSSTLAHEIAIGTRGQYAFGYRLIPQAEQVVGGLYSVRGYDQSAAAGDDVAIGTFEYRFHVPHSLPVSREPLAVPLIGDFRVTPQQVYGRPDWDLILRGFVDVGHTRRNGRACSACEAQSSEFLVGAGVGVELRIRNNLRARLDWASALKGTDEANDTTNAGDHEFHFLFSVLY